MTKRLVVILATLAGALVVALLVSRGAAYPLLPGHYTLVVAGAMMLGIGLSKRDDAGEGDEFGSSRWATPREMKDFGLYSRPVSGVVLGQDAQGKVLSHDGKEHILLFAPTRAGKGVGLIIPTLLSWKDSVVVIDIKGENYALTAARRRAMGHHIVRFAPTELGSAAFNPLLEIRPEKAVPDVQKLVEILTGDAALDKGRDSYWDASAKSLLTAFCLHVLYAGEDKSLRGVLNLMRKPIAPGDGETGHTAILNILANTPHHGEKGVDAIVARISKSMSNLDPKTLSNVWSTAESYLTLFEDPILAAATTGQDFRLTDLQYAEKPVSLFVVIPPSDLDRLRPLLRLIITQMMGQLTETLELYDEDSGPERTPLLLLLDEFPALGRLDFVRKVLGYCAGYGIRAFLIAQDLRQLDEIYGSQNALLSAAHIRVAFATNDDRTAQRISSLLGKTTRRRKTESRSGKRGEMMLSGRSVGEAVHARDLLTPGEVMQLPFDEELILLAGKPPIRARKLTYYNDPRFKPLIGRPPSKSNCPPADASRWTQVVYSTTDHR